MTNHDHDPIKSVQDAGFILSKHPNLFEEFAESFGRSLFLRGNLCQRIDFLMPPDRGGKAFFTPRDPTSSIMETVIWDWDDKEDKIILNNVDKVFGGIKLRISRQDRTYLIEDGYDEWEFETDSIHRPLSGFLNIHRTRLIYFMLLWLTNMLNFRVQDE